MVTKPVSIRPDGMSPQPFDFSYRALPWNIVFAPGSLQRLPEELTKLGHSKALVLTTPNQTAEGKRVLELLVFLVSALSGTSIKP